MKFSSCRSFSMPVLLTFAIGVLAAHSASPMQTIAPALPTNSQLSNSPSIDLSALAMLKKSAETMLALKTYRAEERETVDFGHIPAAMVAMLPDGGKPIHHLLSLTAEKPNLARYEDWEMSISTDGKWSRKTPLNGEDRICRGNTTMTRDENGGIKYDRYSETIDDSGAIWSGFFLLEYSPYSSVMYLLSRGELADLRFDGQEKVDGILCSKIYVGQRDVISKNHRPSHTSFRASIFRQHKTYYIGPDYLVHRETSSEQSGETSPVTSDLVAHNLQVNQPIPNRSTVFTFPPPPKGAKKTRPQ